MGREPPSELLRGTGDLDFILSFQHWGFGLKRSMLHFQLEHCRSASPCRALLGELGLRRRDLILEVSGVRQLSEKGLEVLPGKEISRLTV